VGLERGPLSLVPTTEELLGRKSSGSGLESREYGCRDPSRRPHGTLYPIILALTLPTSGGIVRSWTKARDFFFVQAVFLELVSCLRVKILGKNTAASRLSHSLHNVLRDGGRVVNLTASKIPGTRFC
jgi:hypothetical protein